MTAPELQEWADTWFTRHNAVLWIAGEDVPAGLRLRLRDGVRRELPNPSSALPVTPAYFVDDGNTIVLDSVVRRRASASVFAGVLERELFRALRPLPATGTCHATVTGQGWSSVRRG